MGLLPSTPLACSFIANGGVGVSEHGGVGIDQPQVPQVVWDGVGETVPLLWEDASDILGDPLHLAAGGGGYEAQHQGVQGHMPGRGWCPRTDPKWSSDPRRASHVTPRCRRSGGLWCC